MINRDYLTAEDKRGHIAGPEARDFPVFQGLVAAIGTVFVAVVLGVLVFELAYAHPGGLVPVNKAWRTDSGARMCSCACMTPEDKAKYQQRLVSPEDWTDD